MQENLSPTPQPDHGVVVKFPDPTDTVDEAQIEKITQASTSAQVTPNKSLKKVVFVLVVLPIMAGVTAFVYNTYQDYQLQKSAQEVEQPLQNFNNVQPRELFREATFLTQINPDWKRYTNASAGFSILYPNDWYVVESPTEGYRVQSFDPSTAAEGSYVPSSDAGKRVIRVTQVNTDTVVDSVKDLEDFVRGLSSSDAVELSTVDGLIQVNGFTALKRRVSRPGTQERIPEAFIIDSKGKMFRLVCDFDLNGIEETFDQVLASFQFTDGSDATLWKLFQSVHGYQLRYPDDWALVAGDPSISTQSATPDSPQVYLYLTREKLNEASIKNTLRITTSSTEPVQTATQSATKDLSGKTLRVHEYENARSYVLFGDGKFIEFLITFDSSIEKRMLLENILNTVRFE